MDGPTMSPHIEHAHVLPSGSSSSSSTCTCNSQQKVNARNLVVCIDGTSNRFGQNNTNVVKLLAKINLKTTHPEQYAYYSSGIGMRPKSINIFSRMERAVTDNFDMAAAWNIDEIVKDAYAWLARMYQEGDQIYLFGFSRGAYQVRVLAGMIHEVGLIRTPTEKQVGMAYEYYETIRSRKSKIGQIAKEFKSTFCWTGMRVHFIGVWDTVSSVWLRRGEKFLSKSSSAAHACHFRHALALDERRVKFIPEYFHEMNSQTHDGKSKYIVTSPDAARAATNDSGTDFSDGKKKTPDLKEVWFAGSHSDVGGGSTPGKSHQAGNVSLLWMRQEAAANGLVLEPTDIVWVPDDLDFGTSNSMSPIWRVIEYMPIKQQVSFSGAGENDRRLHRLLPRRIIPGQKVHASVLYANMYKPQATLGEGFDIPIIHSGLEYTELDNRIWEMGLPFEDNVTTAQELVTHLGSQQGVAPIYLDRLLFMLQFKEGKECVRNVPNWKDLFMNLIHNRNCAPLVRLVVIVAYYESSCDPEAHPENREQPQVAPDIFDGARKFLCRILAAHKHPDGPRVLALLRPLTKHQILRERILTQDVLETLVKSFDVFIRQPGWNFGQVIDGLDGLLQCEHTRQTLVENLGANPPSSNVSRLSRILEVNDTHLQISALRMVSTLARIPEARTVCTVVKPRIRELASKDEQRISLLALDILLALYDSNDRGKLNCHDPLVRANIASALVRLKHERHDSGDEPGCGVDPAQQTLRRIFGLDATELNEQQRHLIAELKKAVQKGNSRERTAATKTLLELCETTIIRNYLLEINLLDVFVDQLQRKGSALLAAYALATCLKYNDMKKSIRVNGGLPKHIVGMLKLNYFDDAVGQVEGFQIFGDLMRHADLREQMKNHNITQVLNLKLGRGKPNDIRTSLITLEIFWSLDPDGPWTRELVDIGLQLLQNPAWSVQRAGVTILSALAQTEYGVAAIKPRIYQVVEMLLPEGYLPIQPIPQQATPAHWTSEAADPWSPTSLDAPPRPPSWMLGPACALRRLAQNKTLRDHIRETMQYNHLKYLYLSETLVDEKDTSPWRVKTPNRADVINMLDNMIKAVDEELSDEGLTLIGDAVLPHVQHWDRLLRNQPVGSVIILPALLVSSALAALAEIVFTSIYLCSRVRRFFNLLESHYQDACILDALPGRATEGEHESDTDPGSYGGESASGGHDGEDPSDGCSGEGSEGVETVHIVTQGSGDMQRQTNATNQE